MPTNNFTGTLNHNEIFSSLFNMIISQTVFTNDIAYTFDGLVNKFKTDGTLYGDKKLFYSTDALPVLDWNGDEEAGNLLKLHRPQDPLVEEVIIDQFKMVALTVDNYLTKRAFADEYAYSQFNSRMLGWMNDTKRIYETTLFNSFIGTNKAALGTQNIALDLPAAPASSATKAEQEAYNRLFAQTIAASLADLEIKLKDVSRDYNDYGLLRSYDPNSLIYIWNSDYVNRINKLDLPTIFHNEGLINKFGENVLPARYFGTIQKTSGTTADSNTTVRALFQKDYNTVPQSDASYDPSKLIFPGDLLPGNTAYAANETYIADSKVICKICSRDSVPFMSAFSTGTEFFNPRSLTQTHYLIWGYSEPVSLNSQPFITIAAK